MISKAVDVNLRQKIAELGERVLNGGEISRAWKPEGLTVEISILLARLKS